MDVKSANPFLFTEDDYTSPHSAASNPFLIGGDDYEDNAGPGDNPFLSQSAATMVSTTTNPFAFDPMDLGPTEAQAADVSSMSMQSNLGNTNAFVNTSNEPDLFCSAQEYIPNVNIPPQKPTDLDLKYTNTVANTEDDFQNLVDDGNNRTGPQRPALPARPPPSKETQDLLMSVMGAMDATSSHLLDRIPPTRTPSPVSMRDLHSPSPTPEPTFGDLLDVSDTKSTTENYQQEQQKSNNTNDLLMSLSQENTCDINQNPPMAVNQPMVVNQPMPVNPPIPINPPTAQIAPSRPAPPVRPPRPLPPQKPPAPSFAPTAPPPKPPPPKVVAAQNQQPEMMDMFGIEDVPLPKTKASTADIMNLYNKNTKSEPTDLLFDSIEPAMVTENCTESTIEPANVATSMETSENLVLNTNEETKTTNLDNYVSTPITQDNFLSPEPSQNDLQMDTSDSQSKGSVSSVTFNPFAGTDDANAQGTPRKQSDAFQQDTNLDNNVFQEEPVVTNLNNSYQKKTETIADIFETTTVNITQNEQEKLNIMNAQNAQDSFGLVSTQNNDDAFGFGKPDKNDDVFDAFTQKFESAAKDDKNIVNDAFSGDTWGNDAGSGFNDSTSGFGADESFDAFLAMQEPPAVPQSTPNKLNKSASQDSDEDKDFSVIIKPRSNCEDFSVGAMPILAPPPAAPVQSAFTDSSPRFNPFDQTEQANAAIPNQEVAHPYGDPELKRTDSQETPPTPLFDDDVSQPLEEFPRIIANEDGWEMHLRQPNKKKITGQRFWKKIIVRIVHQQDCVLLQLFNQLSDKDPFQELPLQPCYSVSDIGAQQYDQFGKIFTIKLQYIFYKERPGVRPGQVKKAERITNKLSQFAAYAIQGDYQGVKEFGSDLKKLGLPVEHAPQVSQLMKLGSLSFEDLKHFSVCIEEALFKLQAHRDRALHYKMEEVQITAVDELYVEQDAEGHVEKQIARVRLFFLGFLTGMPSVELGINDMRRQGKEVVGRHDIIPVITEEWIRLENVEFHSCVQQDEYENTHIIKFKPPDACYIELMRFRIRPPKNRELPLQLKATICITGNRVELRADVLVPGFASRKLGQIPCEDVMIRFPIPECWIYLFRVEKHFRYGSVKSAHRRTGKIKGIERILGTVDTLQESLIEVTSGQAKYEHQHRAIVWRCPRLPKEGQGAYTTHNMVCRMALTSYDQMPDQLAEYCYVEFTMPATQASHTTVRSVSLQNSDSDEPPEKYVRYLARHEYRVGIERTEAEGPNAYVAATFTKPAPAQEETPTPPTIPEAESSSDSD